MLGHASAAMTLDVYAGLFPDNLDEVADRLDQASTNLNADQVRTTAARSAVTPLVERRRNAATRGRWVEPPRGFEPRTSALQESADGAGLVMAGPVPPAAVWPTAVSGWLRMSTRGHGGDTEPER